MALLASSIAISVRGVARHEAISFLVKMQLYEQAMVVAVFTSLMLVQNLEGERS